MCGMNKRGVYMNYLFLIKEDYVRDTQISSIGCDVKDLYADELIVEDDDNIDIYVAK